VKYRENSCFVAENGERAYLPEANIFSLNFYNVRVGIVGLVKQLLRLYQEIQRAHYEIQDEKILAQVFVLSRRQVCSFTTLGKVWRICYLFLS